MSIVQEIRASAAAAFKAVFNQPVEAEKILISATKPEFEGDYTVVVFPFTPLSRKKPEETGRLLGDYLVSHYTGLFDRYNVVKGFLNLAIRDTYWQAFLAANYGEREPAFLPPNGKKVMVEYSSPNTNKPLHLGHLRNNFLGYSISKILQANGYEVIKANLVNDRSIHICKSMVAWERYGKGATPATTGMKGDHLVGEYYVRFNDAYKEEVRRLMAGGMPEEEAEKEAPVMKAAQEMLRKWEQGDPVVRELWSTMNEWVYAGFDATYKRLGVSFDKIYYESRKDPFPPRPFPAPFRTAPVA